MSSTKDKIEEKIQSRQRKLEGYKKKLLKDKTYSQDCPSCCEALSFADTKKKQCLHCGIILKWNDES